MYAFVFNMSNLELHENSVSVEFQELRLVRNGSETVE